MKSQNQVLSWGLFKASSVFVLMIAIGLISSCKKNAEATDDGGEVVIEVNPSFF